ncbi:carotenoid oxygenase family protein [Micromonospora chersina]|uniref:carotenoid oxygenase family protein n=1 Tax=Micromonospora chersina TaxID=47854 RepID=UPI003403EA4F
MTRHSRRDILRSAAALTGGAIAVGAGALPLIGSTATAQTAPTYATPPVRRSGGHPFLEGAFAPVQEEVTAFDLPVNGRIPGELNGRYLRIGPNVLGLEDPRAHHWMLGEGMVHGVRLRDGRAEWYRNRWVRSAAVAAKLGERYPWPVPEQDYACNTHVIAHNGRILTLLESGPLPYELDGELNTLGPYDFGGTLTGAFTAHTKLDAHAGELHAVTYSPMWDHVRHLVVDPAGRVARTTTIPVAGSPMMHDFALTQRHVVLFDVPVTFDPEAAAAGHPVPYIWNDRHPARVGVLPRAGGEVRWFDAPAVVVYSHTLNAYDRGTSIVVDLTTFPAPFYAAGRGSGGPGATGTPSLDRWTIDLARGQVQMSRIDDRPQEYPRINDALVSRRHRFGYSAAAAEMFQAYLAVDGVPPDRAFHNALIKHDLLRGTSEVHRFGKGAAASEPVFVPARHPGHGPAAEDHRAAEDDGYALAYVHNPDRNASDLVILAAQDFTGTPVARVQLPARVPLGFHGSWVPDA